MENEKEFLYKKSDSDQKRPFPFSANSLDPSIKRLSNQLVDGFLKDTNFFNSLEKELMSSLKNIKEKRFSRHTKNFSDFVPSDAKTPTRSPESTHSLKYPQGKKTDIFLDGTSSDAVLQSSQALHQQTGNTVSVDSGISDSGDKVDSLEESCQISPPHSVDWKENEKPLVNGQLSKDASGYTASCNSSAKMEKCGKIASCEDGKKENDIAYNADQAVLLNSKKDITNLKDKSLGSNQVKNMHSLHGGIQEEELCSDGDVNDNFKLDIGDIEKELLSISHQEKTSLTNASPDHLDHQEKSISHVQGVQEKDLVFDLNKIIDFEDYLEKLKDIDILVLSQESEEEQPSSEEVKYSFDKSDSASCAKNKLQEIKQNSHSDLLQEDVNKDLHLYSKNVADSTMVHHNEELKSSTISPQDAVPQTEKYQGKNRRFWLKIYILIVIGCGFYWFFQLHREIDSIEKDPRIINAIKDPIKMIPSESTEVKGVSFNQVKEVYDRFSGKSPSSPEQKKLLDLQEVPIDFSQKNGDNEHYQSRDINGGSDHSVDSHQTIVIKGNKDLSNEGLSPSEKDHLELSPISHPKTKQEEELMNRKKIDLEKASSIPKPSL
ncbi:MAG: hypothetical protein EU981_03880 [Candidatus Liberibacter ctenarytainae]|uniref:Transmembrane protein n=1 Tax=Candidatus Liberibacter ctenarytainae TaxID=2020335 RepID=A0A937ACX4_9HYPH|nr:hypothetical protein [Candidatus Liberibacter ctenarytainae]